MIMYTTGIVCSVDACTQTDCEAKLDDSKEKLENEIQTLGDKLKFLQETLTQTENQLDFQKKKTDQQANILKKQLQDLEERRKKERQSMDTRIKDITSSLLFLEGQLRNEQKYITTTLEEKDRQLEENKEKIKALINEKRLRIKIHKLKNNNHKNGSRLNGKIYDDILERDVSSADEVQNENKNIDKIENLRQLNNNEINDLKSNITKHKQIISANKCYIQGSLENLLNVNETDFKNPFVSHKTVLKPRDIKNRYRRRTLATFNDSSNGKIKHTCL